MNIYTLKTKPDWVSVCPSHLGSRHYLCLLWARLVQVGHLGSRLGGGVWQEGVYEGVPLGPTLVEKKGQKHVCQREVTLSCRPMTLLRELWSSGGPQSFLVGPAPPPTLVTSWRREARRDVILTCGSVCLSNPCRGLKYFHEGGLGSAPGSTVQAFD